LQKCGIIFYKINSALKQQHGNKIQTKFSQHLSRYRQSLSITKELTTEVAANLLPSSAQVSRVVVVFSLSCPIPSLAFLEIYAFVPWLILLLC